ncbi:hypothetical protein BCR41DRAFT_304020 [Lobosporangium transversale]|uniref:HTH APSES-type domain-containing protein n=1 Tax=Lobosporangium transversale TaxID=64571 RepID=A0A1Y2GS08_9FUNG|nr:hypothetical protein BCR41DRAFT_304020 [Lobosporangium transversale]ORZ19253.1 hypothetical protein BCR41DRAFT_304020 [Lobosporangium transversale]|eukprot:XP_021882421.1 hypothetical protein BCR41DRAFT_304020 [Lobosporangium transversale]
MPPPPPPPPLATGTAESSTIKQEGNGEGAEAGIRLGLKTNSGTHAEPTGVDVPSLTLRSGAGAGDASRNGKKNSEGPGPGPITAPPTSTPQIFKATYSGVPVFEMISKGVAVMKRRSDSYLNATQILKVAEFDKPQRTRILEREVQKGEHEKVQGGYGKYQGTWVPFERGLQLCQEYNVIQLLQPLLDYQATQASPPLAPKHVTAASNRPRKPREPRIASQIDDASSSTNTSYQRDSSPSVRSKMNRRSTSRTRASDQDDRKSTASSTMTASAIAGGGASTAMMNTPLSTSSSRGPYAETLLEYFISDGVSGLPKILTNPPADIDFNVVIDDEGHTALHWAAAMGKVDVVKLLIQSAHGGVDTYKVNTDGQTALMRSVLFSNNFDQRCFPALLELLQKTIFTIDKDDKTVFHHVAETAGQRGKIHAARYYLECLLEKLAQHPSELASIINVQDHVGDTALTIAARLKIGGKRVVKMLVDAGADLKIRNHNGKNAEDYLLEAEQQQQQAGSALPLSSGVNRSNNNRPSQPSGSFGAQGVIPTVSDLFSRLTQSYEKDIFEKDQDIQEARSLLQGIQAEVREGHRTIHELKQKTVALSQAEEQIRVLETMIKQEIQIRQRLRLEELIAIEEERLRSELLEQGSLDEKEMDVDAVVPALETESEQLRVKLSELQQRRKDRVNQIVQMKSQEGRRRHEYQRLIALCCNVSIDQVDELLSPLLNSLGEDAAATANTATAPIASSGLAAATASTPAVNATTATEQNSKDVIATANTTADQISESSAAADAGSVTVASVGASSNGTAIVDTDVEMADTVVEEVQDGKL